MSEQTWHRTPTETGHDGVPLPGTLRDALEALVDCDLSGIRLRRDPALPALGAVACAQGETIRLSRLAPDPATPAGVAVLGHEIAHVLQQRCGRVGPGSAGDVALEREADRIGRHCAARLFPGSMADPGLPAMDAAARAPRRWARGDAPIQFLRTSSESFRDFRTAAWQTLRMPAAQVLSRALNLNVLYGLAANYMPPVAAAIPPKEGLYGQPRYRAMTLYVEATQNPGPHQVRMQEGAWPDITDDIDDFAAYYTAVADHQQPPLNPRADRLALRYMHVYPAAPANATWRLGINVKPRDMATATAALAPLLDQYPSIDHMKFLGPGAASKADSVIVYLRRDDSYNALRQAVLDAVADLPLEPRVGAMWNEIAPGIGEAGEPPAASFTEYRCVVLYLAFLEYLRAGGTSFEGFERYLRAVMALFGLDFDRPHIQGPRQTDNPAYPSWWNGFVALYRDWTRR